MRCVAHAGRGRSRALRRLRARGDDAVGVPLLGAAPAVDAEEYRAPLHAFVVGSLPALFDAAVGSWRPHDPLPLRAPRCRSHAFHRHRAAIAQAALQTQHAAIGADPELGPTPAAAVVDVETVPVSARSGGPLLMQGTAAGHPLDAVAADHPVAFGPAQHVPVAQPEVELSVLGPDAR